LNVLDQQFGRFFGNRVEINLLARFGDCRSRNTDRQDSESLNLARLDQLLRARFIALILPVSCVSTATGRGLPADRAQTNQENARRTRCEMC
jgi:hypothetical protein